MLAEMHLILIKIKVGSLATRSKIDLKNKIDKSLLLIMSVMAHALV